MAEAPSTQTDTHCARESWWFLVKESTFLNIAFLVVCLASGQQKRNCSRQCSVARYRTNTMNCASFPKCAISLIESCAGWNFLSAPASHPQNLNPPRTRKSSRNLARTRTLPTQPAPAPHFFGLKPAPVRKLLKTPN